MKKKAFDVFISHASEDKAVFVDGLAKELRKRGLEVWYDNFELNVGDSLNQKIEEGLAKSRFGIVVYSPTFFKKKWTKAELNGLFSKEMAGKKRILPIRHNLSVAELRKRYPIQSDKFSLSSSMPLSEICEALMKVIRPELLEPKRLQVRAIEASQAYLESFKAKNPDWDISLQVLPKPDGRLETKIQYRPITAMAAASNEINMQFVGNGVRKIQDLIRTGRQQTWTADEISSIRAGFPFFPPLEKGSIFTAGPALQPPVRLVRVQCGSGTFELMEMKLLRGGTDEIEFEVAAKEVPLKVKVVYPLKNRRKNFNVNLSWSLIGFRPKQCKALIDFVSSAGSGESITITDLRGDTPPINFPTAKSDAVPNYFDDAFRRLVDVCIQIENELKVKIPMRIKVSDEDDQTLRILDSLINKTEQKGDISAPWDLTKGLNKAVDDFICGKTQGQMTVFSAVKDYTGYLELFDTRIPSALWGVWANCIVEAPEDDIKRYCLAKRGFKLAARIKNDGKFRYEWAADHAISKSLPKKR